MKNTFPKFFVHLTWMAFGAALILSFPPFVELLVHPDSPFMWWAGRALGMLAYTALWLSTLFGVLVSSRGAGGLLDRAVLIDLHGRWALMALASTALHTLVILVDPHSGVSALSAFVPVASQRLAGPIALGTFGGWGMLVLGVSTYFMDRIPKTAWRAIHATAFGTFALALVHGIWAGSETQVLAIKVYYAGTTAVVMGAVFQRISLAWLASRGEQVKERSA